MIELNTRLWTYHVDQLDPGVWGQLQWTYQVVTEQPAYRSLHQGTTGLYPGPARGSIRESLRGTFQEPQSSLLLALPEETDRHRISLRWYCWLCTDPLPRVRPAFTGRAAGEFLLLLQRKRGDLAATREAFAAWLVGRRDGGLPLAGGVGEGVTLSARQLEAYESCLAAVKLPGVELVDTNLAHVDIDTVDRSCSLYWRAGVDSRPFTPGGFYGHPFRFRSTRCDIRTTLLYRVQPRLGGSTGERRHGE